MSMDIRDLLKGKTSITFRVRPSASQTRVRDVMDDGTVKLDLAAVPEDGKANAELIRFLVQDCEIPEAEIVSGLTSRKKIVRLKQG